MSKNKRTKPRIRDWKGLLAGESTKAKATVFLLLLLVSIGMSFTQFGFVGVGMNGSYFGYVLGLLGPLTLCALLLGKGLSTLYGLLSGIVLLLHTFIQPLDLYEYYFIGIFNSIVLYTFL